MHEFFWRFSRNILKYSNFWWFQIFFGFHLARVPNPIDFLLIWSMTECSDCGLVFLDPLDARHRFWRFLAVDKSLDQQAKILFGNYIDRDSGLVLVIAVCKRNKIRSNSFNQNPKATDRIIGILWIIPKMHGKSVDATPQAIPFLFWIGYVEESIGFRINEIQLLLIANLQWVAQCVHLTAENDGWRYQSIRGVHILAGWCALQFARWVIRWWYMLSWQIWWCEQSFALQTETRCIALCESWLRDLQVIDNTRN